MIPRVRPRHSVRPCARYCRAMEMRIQLSGLLFRFRWLRSGQAHRPVTPQQQDRMDNKARRSPEVECLRRVRDANSVRRNCGGQDEYASGEDGGLCFLSVRWAQYWPQYMIDRGTAPESRVAASRNECARHPLCRMTGRTGAANKCCNGVVINSDSVRQVYWRGHRCAYTKQSSRVWRA
jgi:hypothetical protein